MKGVPHPWLGQERLHRQDRLSGSAAGAGRGQPSRSAKLQVWRGQTLALEVPLKDAIGGGARGPGASAPSTQAIESELGLDPQERSREADGGRAGAGPVRRPRRRRGRGQVGSGAPAGRAPRRSGASPVVLTREPGGSPDAEASARGDPFRRPRRAFGAEGEALLFSAARIDHIDATIAPGAGARRLGGQRPLRQLDARLPGRQPSSSTPSCLAPPRARWRSATAAPISP